MWVPRMELLSVPREVHALDHGAVSPAFWPVFLKTECLQTEDKPSVASEWLVDVNKDQTHVFGLAGTMCE